MDSCKIILFTQQKSNVVIQRKLFFEFKALGLRSKCSNSFYGGQDLS